MAEITDFKFVSELSFITQSANHMFACLQNLNGPIFLILHAADHLLSKLAYLMS